MAAPVTHILLAKKLLQTKYITRNETYFMIGTCFPDIRCLGTIDRHKLHSREYKLADISNASPFTAGLIFHSVVDKTREEFARDHDLYSLIPNTPFASQATKFLEDELLYGLKDNWKKTVDHFNSFINEELVFGLDSKEIKKWHITLQNYFSSKPTNQKILEYISSINHPKDIANEIIKTKELIKKNKEVIRILNKFYNNFEDLIGINRCLTFPQSRQDKPLSAM